MREKWLRSVIKTYTKNSFFLCYFCNVDFNTSVWQTCLWKQSPDKAGIAVHIEATSVISKIQKNIPHMFYKPLSLYPGCGPFGPCETGPFGRKTGIWFGSAIFFEMSSFIFVYTLIYTFLLVCIMNIKINLLQNISELIKPSSYPLDFYIFSIFCQVHFMNPASGSWM